MKYGVDEFINREDVREMMRMEFDGNYADEAVDRLPAADVAPVRRGEWVWDNRDVYTCTHCGGKSHVKEVMEKPDWDFCPLCGAEMKWEGRRG